MSRRLAAPVLLAVVSLLAASCSSGGSSLGHRSSTTTPKAAKKRGKATAAVRTWLGPGGVESSAVIAENKKPGTTSWQITNEGPGYISGFANLNYAKQGDEVGLYVSTDQPTFHVVAYRMGWYGGTGARAVWQSGTVKGKVQPPCTVQHSTNMVSCDNWSRSLTFDVTSAFVPGDYLLKLVGTDNRQSYVLLTIWDPSSTATYLVVNRSMVEEGWNTYGGYDFYQGEGPCILDSQTYPPCNRSRVVSFDRPYAGNGSSDFLPNEYPMIEFMEEEGLNVTYCTDVCISQHPGFLKQHKAIVFLDHDEIWTNSERVGVLQAASAGVNMAFFGAATLVRHARLQASPLGPAREVVDYRNPAEDPLNGHGSPWQVTGNTWAAPPTNWDATTFLGQLYSGFLPPGEPSAPMKVYDASSWFFQGTGLKNGSLIPSAINSDFEHLYPQGPMPGNIQVLAHSPIPLSHVYTNQGQWGGYTYSDVTYYTYPHSLAGIFDSGDNIWVGTLASCSPPTSQCPAGTMRQLTANVLHLFGEGPAGRFQPSRPNWRSVTPYGS